MESHKRYLVFGYDRYYPLGGIRDCFDSFDTLDEAKKAVEKDKENSDNHQIYDRIEGALVEISHNNLYK